jgi:hypothetical protein
MSRLVHHRRSNDGLAVAGWVSRRFFIAEVQRDALERQHDWRRQSTVVEQRDGVRLQVIYENWWWAASVVGLK